MRLMAARDLVFSAKPLADDGRVIIRMGTLRFTASCGEAIDLAKQIVDAVDKLKKPGGDPQ